MVPRVIAVLIASAGLASAAIDFTPIPFEVQFEGGPAQQPGFMNGGGKVTFAPPSGWTLEGAGPELKLTPKDALLSSAWIQTRRLTSDAVGSDAILKSCRDEVTAALPRNAESVEWQPVELNPVLLNRHESARVEVCYKVLGQSFRSTMLVCNLADQQLRFFLSARERDYTRVYQDFRRSLYTWQGLK